MKFWFTSDYHLGHYNIIKYCNRPFQTLEQMNQTIIQNHNNRVKPEDTVFFIGDFCFKNSPGGKKGEGDILKAIEYEKQLNGKLIFIKGNHDRNNSCKAIIEKLSIYFGGKRISLVHNPEFVDINFGINLVGHIHEKWQIKRIKKGWQFTDAINVGVDVWDFRPVSLEEIMKRYKKWIKNSPKN